MRCRMSKIECKYKYQDPEKFNGKPYCLLHNELCEDLSFACDKNCQVYEDYKELAEYKDSIEKWMPAVSRIEMEFKTSERINGISCKTYTEAVFEKIDKLETKVKELKQIINKSASNFCNDYLDTIEENKELKKAAGQILFTNHSLMQINENLFGTLKQIKNACNGIYTKTNEAKQLKNLIMKIVREVIND